MKKVAWITADFFVDVDLPILPIIASKWKISWYIIIPNNDSRYNVEFLISFAKENEIDVKLILMDGRRRNIRNIKKYINMLFDIKKQKFDLFYYESIIDPFIYLLSLLTGKNIIALHDVKVHSNYYSKSHIILHNLVIHSFTIFQTFSNTQSQALKSLHNKNSFVIPLACKDSGKATVYRPIITDRVKFLFFGGIYSYKRLDILIQAFEKLSTITNKRINLTIAGKGPNWNFCSTFIKKGELYDLTIGFIDQSVLPNMFCEHHFLVLPYQDVTQSGPLFDAFNYNLPTIASNQSGFEEFLVNNATGFIFETNNICDLTDVMNKCVNLTQEEYTIILNNLEEYSKLFKKEQIAEKYIDMFNIVSTQK